MVKLTQNGQGDNRKTCFRFFFRDNGAKKNARILLITLALRFDICIASSFEKYEFLGKRIFKINIGRCSLRKVLLFNFNERLNFIITYPSSLI